MDSTQDEARRKIAAIFAELAGSAPPVLASRRRRKRANDWRACCQQTIHSISRAIVPSISERPFIESFTMRDEQLGGVNMPAVTD